jgi:hypothetical protein
VRGKQARTGLLVIAAAVEDLSDGVRRSVGGGGALRARVRGVEGCRSDTAA